MGTLDRSRLSATDHTASRFDAVVIVLLTIAAAVILMRFELTETFFDSTRDFEHLQLDELPATLLVLVAGLAWFAWRRRGEAKQELHRREAAESRLAALLLEHRRLTQQHVQIQESERKALARELHDELGQYLNAIKTDAVAIQSKRSGQEAVERAASAIVSHCDHLQQVVRELIGQLRPVGLDVLGLRSALEHLMDYSQQRAPDRKFCVSLEGDLDSLDEDVALTIYRLIQEGLTNVARHAEAHCTEVSVTRLHIGPGDEVRVRVTDDGRGSDPAAEPLGFGLIGMRERVEMLAGELQIETRPQEGFRIFARIPARSLRL